MSFRSCNHVSFDWNTDGCICKPLNKLLVSLWKASLPHTPVWKRSCCRVLNVRTKRASLNMYSNRSGSQAVARISFNFRFEVAFFSTSAGKSAVRAAKLSMNSDRFRKAVLASRVVLMWLARLVFMVFSLTRLTLHSSTFHKDPPP